MKSKLLLAANIVFILQLLVISTLVYVLLTSDGSIGGLGPALALSLICMALIAIFVTLGFIIFLSKTHTNLLFRIAVGFNLFLVFVVWYNAVF